MTAALALTAGLILGYYAGRLTQARRSNREFAQLAANTAHAYIALAEPWFRDCYR